MPLSLRRYSLPELQALLREIEAAIRAAERPERKPRKRVAAAVPPVAPAPTAPVPATAAAPVTPTADIAAAIAPPSEPANPPVPSPAEPATPIVPVDAAVPQAEAAPIELVSPPAAEPASAPAEPVVRYMHPANRNMTWTGVGEQPEWLTVYLTQGGSWTALENTAQKFAFRRR